MFNIPMLPSEIISKILEYLTHRERLQVTLVNKEWYNLVYEAKFSRRMLLRLNRFPQFDKLTILKGGLLFERCRNAVMYYDIITAHKKLPLLIEFLANVWCLEIKDTPLMDLVVFFKKCLPHMQQLTTLIIGSPPGPRLLDADETLQLVHGTLKHLWIDSSLYTTIVPECPALIEIKITSADVVLSINQSVERIWLDRSQYWPNDERLIDGLKCLRYEGQIRNPDSLLKSLGRMKQLQKLCLAYGTFPLTRNFTFSSESITEFSLYSGVSENIVLPELTNLYVCSIIHVQESTPSLLAEICAKYPKLKKMVYGAPRGEIGMFASETFATHICGLKQLKILQFDRLSLHNVVSWCPRNGHDLQKLRLHGCAIDGSSAQILALAYTNLMEFFLDNCYLRHPSQIFDVEVECSAGLRSLVPRCRVSYYDCHIEERYDMCAGRPMPAT